MFHIYEVLWTGFIFGTTCAIAAAIISPLQFLKIIKQETSHSYYDIIKDSYEKYGIKIFFKCSLSYALTNFFSSMSFGISEHLYSYMYSDAKLINSSGIIICYMIALRAIMGGFFESCCSGYFELIEIIRNKEHIMSKKAKFSHIFLPILVRNIIFWHGSVISYVLNLKYNLSYFNFTILSFILGVCFGLISLPFDVVATRSCGAQKSMNMFCRLIDLLHHDSGRITLIFSGTVMRMIQMGILTMITAFTMLLFDYFRLGL